MAANPQMNNHKIVGLADAVEASDGVYNKTLDTAVNSLAGDMRAKNKRNVDLLILATDENDF